MIGVWAGPAAAQTLITSNVTSNTTWTAAGSPYILEPGTVTVATGVTLTIEPGVTVELNPKHETFYGILHVSGTISAVGSAASPIVFTSVKAGEGVGAPGQYAGVQVQSGNALSQFSYVDFFDAGSGAPNCEGSGALAVSHASTATIEHSTFEMNAGAGLQVSVDEGKSSTANVSYSTFAHNCTGLSAAGVLNVSHSNVSFNNLEGDFGGNGVHLEGFATASVFTNDTIHANRAQGIDVYATCGSPLSAYPHGEHNNIYENNPSKEMEQQLALEPNVFTCQPPLEVNWSNNYWGEVVYHTNSPSCAGTITPYKGKLSYTWIKPPHPWEVPEGPIDGGKAYYGSSEATYFQCPWDNFNIEAISTTLIATGAPELAEPAEPELRGGYSEASPGLKQCGRGDPVNCATGKLYENQTDLTIPGLNGGLTFTRSYNSQAAVSASTPGPLGYGWTFDFGASLSVNAETHVATVTNANGATAVFTPTSGGAYSAPPWAQATLLLNGEGNYIYTLPDQRVLTFNGSGVLQKLADRNGNTTTLTYAGGRLETITDPSGRKITLAYNGEGLIESVKDPMAHLVKYAYEGGNLSSVTEPGELTPRWQFKYDSSHELTEVIDGRGGKTISEYDSSHRVVEQKDPLTRKTTWVYSLRDTQVTDPTGSVTDMKFAANLPTSVTQGSGTGSSTTEMFYYNANFAPIRVVDGNGRATNYTYDAEGNRTSLVNADGNESRWTYNKTHDVVSETTPKGETTTITRDSRGNPETVSRPAPASKTQTTKYKYNAKGELESTTDPLEHTTKYEYDTHGAKTSETDPEADKRTWAYNEDSLETSTVSPRGNVTGGKPLNFTTSIERDEQGRPKLITDPLKHLTKYTYDANGNLATLIDPLLHETVYTYDADNELTNVAAPLATTKTEYDGAGRVKAQIDGNEHKTEYVRNAIGEVTEVKDALSRKTTKTYDGDGRLRELTDPAKRTTTYNYDVAGLLKEVTYSDGKTPTVKYEYDADGNRTSMTDGTGKSTYTYDQLDRLTEAKDGHGDLTSYEYDLANEQTALTYPSGKAVSRTYDNAGRLKSVTDWLEHTTQFAYNADSEQLATTFPASTGNSDTYAYDNADQMSEVKMLSGIETLASLLYTRNKNGEVLSATTKGLPGEERPTFTYDTNNRLTKGAGIIYKYDAANNPTKIGTGAYTYGMTDQVETGPSIKYTFDELGERVKTTPTSGPATSYGYDQAGNLTSATRPKEGETPAIEDAYAYDGNGLRASQTIGITTTYLAWDASGGLPLLLSDGANNYIYGPSGLPVEQVTGESVLYLHHDQQGSTRLLTGSTGIGAGSFTYDAYGNLLGSTGGSTTPLGYDAEYTSADTGLIYLRARTYDPKTAQFLSVDPFFATTRAPYGYASQNPTSGTDPTGLGEGILDTLGNAAAGAVEPFTFGLSTAALNAIGIEPNVCSSAYELAGATAVAASLLTGVGEIDLAATGARLVIGRTADLTAESALAPGEYTLLNRLPDLGSARANWYQNSSVLRQELRNGAVAIRDASPGDTSGQFLNAERNVLANRGWTFDAGSSLWRAP